jgi:hypothetical protein
MNLMSLGDRALGSVEMLARKHGPAILTGIGVAGFMGTTVLVGRAVLRSQNALDKLKKDTHEVRVKEVTDDYSKNDQAVETARVYMQGAAVLLKIYGPAIGLGAASIICVISAHGLMRKQQAALLAAYSTLDSGFRAYRARIEEEFGKDREQEFYRGAHKEVVEDKELYTTHNYADIIPSPYSRFFDESSPNWSKTPEYNLLFLHAQQQWANDRLKSHGFLFLNEVLEALGLERSQAGQIVGWKTKENGGKDGYVDFGIYDINDEVARAFVNGIETTVLLDFNVDGPIAI